MTNILHSFGGFFLKTKSRLFTYLKSTLYYRWPATDYNIAGMHFDNVLDLIELSLFILFQ